MAESIARQLDELERVGRVSARAGRAVHAEFGFREIPAEEIPAEETPAEELPDSNQPEHALAANLDTAWSRLKSRIAPE